MITLEQVEILASMFHLELRTFQQGGDGQKALSVTEQTAPLSTGGRLQVTHYSVEQYPNTQEY